MIYYRRNNKGSQKARRILAVLFACLLAAGSSAHGEKSPENFSLTLSYGEFRTIPLTMPLETVIGNYYLGNSYTVKGQYLSSDRDDFSSATLIGELSKNTLESAWINISSVSKNPIYNSKKHTSLQISNQNSMMQFDFLKMRSDTFENYRAGDLYLSSLTLGYGLVQNGSDLKSPVNLLVGVSSIYNSPEYRGTTKLYGTEYGTVFFIPGLQLTRRSVMFEAMLELPVYSLNHRDENPAQNDVRTNFGLKYILR